MNPYVKEIESKVVALEAVIQDQPRNQEDADMLSELCSRLLTCSNAVRDKNICHITSNGNPSCRPGSNCLEPKDL